MRKNWLTAVMVIAYKYPYGHDETLVGEKIVGLLRIVIHTLAAQSHVCDRYLLQMDHGFNNFNPIYHAIFSN